MKEVKAYVCSYCGGCVTTDYNLIVEHEKRCSRNPNKKRCSCLLCIHGKVHHRKQSGYQGREITVAYAICDKGLGNKFDYVHDYCESFVKRETDFMKKIM